MGHLIQRRFAGRSERQRGILRQPLRHVREWDFSHGLARQTGIGKRKEVESVTQVPVVPSGRNHRQGGRPKSEYTCSGLAGTRPGKVDQLHPRLQPQRTDQSFSDLLRQPLLGEQNPTLRHGIALTLLSRKPKRAVHYKLLIKNANKFFKYQIIEKIVL